MVTDILPNYLSSLLTGTQTKLDLMLKRASAIFQQSTITTGNLIVGNVAIPINYEKNLSLPFPPAVESDRDKVIFALWKTGEQCFCNLRLLTGLGDDAIRIQLAQLIDDGIVTKKQFGAPDWLPEEIDATGRIASMHTFCLKQ